MATLYSACYMEDKNQTLFNLIGLADELQLPAIWLREKAISGKIPCLFVGRKKMLFNLEAVKKALADLAAKGGGNE